MGSTTFKRQDQVVLECEDYALSTQSGWTLEYVSVMGFIQNSVVLYL